MTIELTNNSTPFDTALQNLRDAQKTFEDAEANMRNITVEKEYATISLNEAGDYLHEAKKNLYKEAIKEPWRPDVQELAVENRYIRIAEGVDAAWSDKGPDADSDTDDNDN